MRAKAKSSSTPYPIWVEGEYITEPPIRPSDGAIRPAGHYIDKGGYPGANVYEVDINTMCRQTDAADRFGKPIYENAVKYRLVVRIWQNIKVVEDITR